MRRFTVVSLFAIVAIVTIGLAMLRYPIHISRWHSRDSSSSEAATTLDRREMRFPSTPSLLHLSLALIVATGGVMILHRPDLFHADYPHPSRRPKDDPE